LETQEEIERLKSTQLNVVIPILLGGAVGAVAVATVIDRFMDPERRWWWERLFYPRTVIYPETVGRHAGSEPAADVRTGANFGGERQAEYSPPETLPSTRGPAGKKYVVMPEKPVDEDIPVPVPFGYDM